MNSNRNKAAFPRSISECEGLSKREYMAGQIAAGIVAENYKNLNPITVASEALKIADTILGRTG